MPACELPGLRCASDGRCDPETGLCVRSRDAGVDDEDGSVFGSQGPGRGEPIAGGAAPHGGTRPGSPRSTPGLQGAAATGAPPPGASEGPASPGAPAEASTRHTEPGPRCGLKLCHPRQHCVEERCELWPCGEGCRGGDRCVEDGEQWRCEQGPCREDRFGGTNAAPGGAAEILGGTYDLSLCAAPEDWFSITLPAGMGLFAEAAFDAGEADLDLELHAADALGARPLSAALGFGRSPTLVHRASDEQDEDLLLRVTQPVAPGRNPKPIRYTLQVELSAEPPCRSNSDCSEPGQVCVVERRRCEDRHCERNVKCNPDERCIPSSGECEALPCEPDQFEGENTTVAEAAPLDVGALYEGLSICEAERDWYVVEVSAGHCVHVVADFRVPAFEGVSYDIDLNLYERPDDNSLVASAMRRIGDGEQLWHLVRTGGPHFLEVTHAVRNTYSLRIEQKPGQCVVPCASMDDCMHMGLRCDTARGQCVR